MSIWHVKRCRYVGRGSCWGGGARLVYTDCISPGIRDYDIGLRLVRRCT